MNLKDLSDTPLINHPTPTQEVESFLELLDDLLDDDRYWWASSTLMGIRQTVREANAVTAGQRKAVGNIQTSVQEKEDKTVWSRRYEGMNQGRGR